MRSFRTVRRALWRSAISLFAVGQLVLALAAFTEARFGADARSHVEAAGTSTHHAHDAGDCTACAARALLAVPSPAAHTAIESQDSAALSASQRVELPRVSGESGSRPRAPPFRQA